MDATDNAPDGAGAAVPGGNQPEENADSPGRDERDLLEKEIIRSAEIGDRLRFDAAVSRYGDLADARKLVRERAVVRSVDRIANRQPSEIEVREVEARGAESTETSGERVMFGHFSVFDEWTEIDSYFEGRFMERISPGAYKKTFRENRANIKPLFQHGHDPVIGDKPLGPVDDLREDDIGAYYEVPLLDAPYVKDIEPGLREGLYGASFRFKSMREDFVEETERSSHNPEAIPERTLKELRVYEFGPVTFPAYHSATAGLRSANADEGPAPTETKPPDEAPRAPVRRETGRKSNPMTKREWEAWRART